MTRDICKEPCKLLQDACLIAGKVKELERENADLRDNYDQFKASAIPEIERLQKENAELKETLKTYNGCGDWDNDFHACRVYLQHEELQMYIDQLTKAIEIIKEFIRLEYADFTNGDYSNELSKVLEQAEQFLEKVK